MAEASSPVAVTSSWSTEDAWPFVLVHVSEPSCRVRFGPTLSEAFERVYSVQACSHSLSVKAGLEVHLPSALLLKMQSVSSLSGIALLNACSYKASHDTLRSFYWALAKKMSKSLVDELLCVHYRPLAQVEGSRSNDLTPL
jgi:hypothetical protein